MSAALITPAVHPKLLWPGVKVVWGQVRKMHTPEFQDLYAVQTSDKAYEQDVQVTGFSLAPVKPIGQDIALQTEQQGFITTYRHVSFGLGYAVAYEEIRDNLYKEVATRRAKSNAIAMDRTVEYSAAFLYNNAASSTYFTTADGVALLSASHAHPTGLTFSNILATGATLSEAALEDMWIQIMQAKDEHGNPYALMPQSLHVGPTDFPQANRIMKTMQQTGTGNNDINVVKAMNVFPKGIKLNHYLTTPGQWFVRTDAPEGMKFYWRDKPKFEKDNDKRSKNEYVYAYMAYSLGCTDPMGVYGSLPA